MARIVIPADYEHLSLAYEFVEAQAKALGLSNAEIYDIKLATDEAVTNIILHGYCGCEGEIQVDVEQHENALIVVLTDCGRLYDPTKKIAPDLNVPLSRRSKGGMGVYLMKKNLDQMSYQQTDDGRNRLTMVKKKALA
ncbi:MAG: ATP-binding protein [Gammaproteobacteria bacterium]|nr:ATP-binding protein [Gammaproteobacteria bacterium]